MRSKSIDWIMMVHYKLKLMPETLYLCIFIFDKFL